MTVHYIGGVDPGKKGGLVLLQRDTHALARVLHVPIIKEKQNHRGRAPTIKTHIDWPKLVREWGAAMSLCDFIVIERLTGTIGGSKMRKDGSASQFKLGYSAGGFHILALANGIPVELRVPMVWRKIVGVVGEKEESFAKAKSLFPGTNEFDRVTVDEGVCEAALIAYSGILRPPGDADGNSQAA